MIVRCKFDDRLLRARLNHQHTVGRHRDPALEVQHEQAWCPLGPEEMADHFEIVTATKVEMEQLAMLTAYGLQFAADFGLTTPSAVAAPFAISAF